MIAGRPGVRGSVNDGGDEVLVSLVFGVNLGAVCGARVEQLGVYLGFTEALLGI